MSSTSEQGHIKNVANFQDLINACITYALLYNPSRATLQILALNGLLAAAQSEMNNVLAIKTTIGDIINQRKEKFRQIPDLATRIVNGLDASGATDAVVRDAKTHLKKIRGQRANTTPAINPDGTFNPDGTPAPTISVSQRSFDKMVEHFQALVAIATSDPNYAPNEVELQPAALNNIITELQNSNSAESLAKAQLSAALIARNAVLYTPGTGLCDIATEVKKYIKSLFGASSPQYKFVSKITFKKRKL